METMYSKLYEKYNEVKRMKESTMEQFSRDQELKFLNYVSAVEELVEHLTSENDRLKVQKDELTHEVVSIRSDKERLCSEYQKLLTDETQKNKELSEEIERLQKLQREGLCCSSKERNSDNVQFYSPGGTQVGSENNSTRSLRKKQRSQHVASQTNGATLNQMQLSLVTEQGRDSCNSAAFDNGANIQQPNRCTGNTTTSGGFVSANCPFQLLIEYVVGMKFASLNETEGLCLSALHQSSGYSYSLTWASEAGKEQVELLYQVLSLGTLERVAPDWMKEDVMFSTSIQLKKDKKYLLERLLCGISRMKRDNTVEKLRKPRMSIAIKKMHINNGSRAGSISYDAMLPGTPDEDNLFSQQFTPLLLHM